MFWWNTYILKLTLVSYISYTEWSERFALENTIGKVRENQEGSQLNGVHQPFLYTDYVNLLGQNINIIKNNTKVLLHASKQASVEMNADKTLYYVSCFTTKMQNCSRGKTAKNDSN